MTLHKPKTVPFPGVAGVILAGGRSSRFGENKALIRVGGVTLIEQTARILRPLFSRMLLVTNEPDVFRFLALPMEEDRIKGLGPLGGIYTALKTINDPYAFVVACDMPALNPKLIRSLVGLRTGYDVVIPRIEEWLEPLHAVYSIGCVEAIEANIGQGIFQILRFFDRMRVRYVEKEELLKADPGLHSFSNINTHEDLKRFLGSNKLLRSDS